MKATYKNKRDLYKAQAAENLRRAEEAEHTVQKLLEEKRKLEEKKATPKKDEWYPVTVYCKNCKYVSSYKVQKGISVSQAGCAQCEMKGEDILFPVVSYPGKW